MLHSDKKLNEVMTRDPEVIRPDASIQEAARKMKDLNVGSVPVCDGDRLMGMVTDRDITLRAVAEGRDPKMTRVNETMTKGVIYCFEDQTLKDAADLMAEKQIRRLPVLSREKRLVGIISLGDVSIEGNDQTSGNTLQDISRPSHPDR